jgi:hypothetical protein
VTHQNKPIHREEITGCQGPGEGRKEMIAFEGEGNVLEFHTDGS